MESKNSSIEILREVKRKRGYLLPYHELFWSLDPDLLEKYDRFYEHMTLKARILDNKTKELVWIGLLLSVREESLSIHLDRGRAAGITDDEISSVIKLVQLAKGFETLSFIQEKWTKFIPKIDVIEVYRSLLEDLYRGLKIPPKVAELIFIAVYSAYMTEEALRLHLIRAKGYGARDEEMAEAMSYVVLARGGNTMLEASKVLKDAVKRGEVRADSVFKCWLEEDLFNF